MVDDVPRDTPWARSGAARLARRILQQGILLPLLAFVNPVSVAGRHRLRGLGPAVFVANHQSHLDAPACLTAVGRRVRGRLVVVAAADYFYRTRLRGVLASLVLGTIPFVRRGGSSRASLDLLKRLIGEGWSILIFPAGTRGAATKLRPGFAYVAVDTGVPVVPIHLAGPDHAMPKGSRLPLPGGLIALIGDPLEPGSDYDDLVARTARAFDELAHRLAA